MWKYAVKAEIALRATSMKLILKSLDEGTDVVNYEREEQFKPRMTVNTPLYNLRRLAYEMFPGSGKSCAWESWDYDYKTWKKTKQGIKRLVKLYHSNALETYKAETHYDEYLYGKYYRLKKTKWLKGEPMCFGVVMCRRILE